MIKNNWIQLFQHNKMVDHYNTLIAIIHYYDTVMTIMTIIAISALLSLFSIKQNTHNSDIIVNN